MTNSRFDIVRSQVGSVLKYFGPMTPALIELKIIERKRVLSATIGAEFPASSRPTLEEITEVCMKVLS